MSNLDTLLSEPENSTVDGFTRAEQIMAATKDGHVAVDGEVTVIPVEQEQSANGSVEVHRDIA